MKMFKGLRNDTFVCLDDVSGSVEDMNYVIYNPSKDAPHERINKLYERVKERFGVGLTSEQLDHLTKYDSFELHQFVQELKQIIRDAKK